MGQLWGRVLTTDFNWLKPSITEKKNTLIIIKSAFHRHESLVQSWHCIPKFLSRLKRSVEFAFFKNSCQFLKPLNLSSLWSKCSFRVSEPFEKLKLKRIKLNMESQFSIKVFFPRVFFFGISVQIMWCLTSWVVLLRKLNLLSLYLRWKNTLVVCMWGENKQNGCKWWKQTEWEKQTKLTTGGGEDRL